MFDQTFTDPSSRSGPALGGLSWMIAFALAALGFLLWYLLMPAALSPGGARVLQAVGLGALPLFFTVLMLCYVTNDARRLGFGRSRWVMATLFLSVIGFVIYLIYAAHQTKQWRRAAIPISYAIELAAIGALLVYPLIATNALPNAQLMSFLTAPPPPAAAPPSATPPRAPAHRVSMMELLKTPTVIPKSITRIKERPEAPSVPGISEAVPGSVPHGASWGNAFNSTGATPPPPPAPPAPKRPQRIRVGGSVESAKAIYRPTPVYPALAQQARVEGVVRLEAVIGRDGVIQNLHAISGHPLLVPAALNAVKQWRYEPTLLDGVPVEVVTEIDVEFTLADN